MSEEKPLNIYQRLNAVREKVTYLKKDKAVQGYKAITHDAVTAAVREYFVEYGIVIVPKELESRTVDTGSVTSGGTSIVRFEAKYDIELVNIDDPNDKVVSTLTVHALDHGDKAPGKAVSYAVKTTVLKVLFLETGEGDESRVEGTRPYTKEQKEKFDTLLEEGNDIEFYALTNSLSDEAQIALINSFPKGKKTELKAKARGLETSGVKKIVAYSEELAKAADAEDHGSVEQLAGEMSYEVKKAVFELLSQDHRDKLSIMREAAA